MNPLVQDISKENLRADLPAFAPGDRIKVMVRIVEGDKERLQPFEGDCIARKGSGVNETFTVRRISYGVGMERVFPVHSPRIASVEVLRKGKVRRAKLYYLRGKRGKAAKIRENREALMEHRAAEREAMEAARLAAEEARRAEEEAKAAADAAQAEQQASEAEASEEPKKPEGEASSES